MSGLNILTWFVDTPFCLLEMLSVKRNENHGKRYKFTKSRTDSDHSKPTTGVKRPDETVKSEKLRFFPRIKPVNELMLESVTLQNGSRSHGLFGDGVA